MSPHDTKNDEPSRYNKRWTLTLPQTMNPHATTNDELSRYHKRWTLTLQQTMNPHATTNDEPSRYHKRWTLTLQQTMNSHATTNDEPSRYHKRWTLTLQQTMNPHAITNDEPSRYNKRWTLTLQQTMNSHATTNTVHSANKHRILHNCIILLNEEKIKCIMLHTTTLKMEVKDCFEELVTTVEMRRCHPDLFVTANAIIFLMACFIYDVINCRKKFVKLTFYETWGSSFSEGIFVTKTRYGVLQERETRYLLGLNGLVIVICQNLNIG
jgi:6-phosphogluconolactonase/glucosamine-6-phosphate isomerase/deaminase